MTIPLRLVLVAALGGLLSQVQAARAALPESQPAGKIESRVVQDTAEGRQTSCVVLLDQADLSGAYAIRYADARGWYVYNRLRQHAKRSQRGLRAFLRAHGIRHRALWGVDAVVVSGDRALVNEIAARPEVRAIESNRRGRWINDPPRRELPLAATAPNAVEWGVANVNAPQVWAMGYTGQGIVVGNPDTGVQWDHPALRPHYRGWNGTTADHNYNWHDAIHSGGGACGVSSLVPCDDSDHGTHTTGIAVGDDTVGNQIGVAPGAKWMACRNMDQGNGTPATYTECFQFFIAPTDLNGSSPDPTRRPHVINNSWGCPPSEGCAASTLQTIVENAQAAGIFVEVSAGNAGPGCSTVQDPAAIYDAAFTAGAFDITNTLIDFSARGPVTVDGSNRLKPNVVAPGGNIRSSVPGNGYAPKSGTSMAGPHVVGVVALLWSARPQLSRDIAATKTILQNTANPNVTVGAQTCGGTSVGTIPNNTFGYGRVDALAAVNAVALGTATPTPTLTPTATPTSTPTHANMLSGRVHYFVGDRSVPNVTVRLRGSVDTTTQTDNAGQFAFPNVPGATWTLEPMKAGDSHASVTALDAVYVLQAAVGLRTLDPMQALAGDVTGNGTISALDAANILQFALGLTPHLPVAQTCNSDWAFVPAPIAVPNQAVVAPQISSGMCQPGAITYTPLTMSATGQDFTAVLFGDCTGSWQP